MFMPERMGEDIRFQETGNPFRKINLPGMGTAASGFLLAGVANKRRFEQPGTGSFRLYEAVGVSLQVSFHFFGDGCRILADTPCDGFESHPFGKAFLNLDPLVQGQVLVLVLISIHCLSSFFSQTKLHRQIRLTLTSTATSTVEVTL